MGIARKRGDRLAIDLIEKVKQAEDAAEQVRQDALAQAREMIKAVEDAALASERQTSAMSREQSAEFLAETRKQTQADIDAQARQAEEEREALRAKAQGKLSDAAALIYERILHYGDH